MLSRISSTTSFRFSKIISMTHLIYINQFIQPKLLLETHSNHWSPNLSIVALAIEWSSNFYTESVFVGYYSIHNHVLSLK